MERNWSADHVLASSLLTVAALVLIAFTTALWWHNSRLTRANLELDRAVKAARSSRRQAQDLLYASEIARANDALLQRNAGQAALLLDRYDPTRSARDVDVEWWLLATELGKFVRAVRLSSEPLYAITISPNGKLIAAAGKDATIYLCDGRLLTPIREIATGQTEVNRLAFPPDGRTVASAGDDGTVRLWDVATGTERLCIESGPERATHVQFADAGRHVITANNARPSVKLWDAESGRLLKVVDPELKGVEGITVSPDESILAVAGWYSRTCRVYDLRGGWTVGHRGCFSGRGRSTPTRLGDGAFLLTIGSVGPTAGHGGAVRDGQSSREAAP